MKYIFIHYMCIYVYVCVYIYVCIYIKLEKYMWAMWYSQARNTEWKKTQLSHSESSSIAVGNNWNCYKTESWGELRETQTQERRQRQGH
jgi:hypothetical protein